MNLLHDALFYEKCADKVKCMLCPHHCIISEGRYGLCRVRTNIGGTLKTINYGEITSLGNDPLEKKPLYHFKPGKNIISIGSFGCNFTCSFCQNYSISQYLPESEYMSPEGIIDIAAETRDNTGIAFTYNEPSIWYEYVYETSKKLKETHKELSVVLVTNGYIEKEPLEKLLPYVDAMNIDLKSFNDEYYKKICGGDLKSVMNTIENAYGKCHIEITTLMVSGMNDSAKETGKIAYYLSQINKNIPLHLSRYFPMYKMKNPPTSIETLQSAKETAQKYLNYVYIGNTSDEDSNTYCPECGTLLVERHGYSVHTVLKEDKCPNCGCSINIVL